MRPNRKSWVAKDRPKSCVECKNKKCLKTGVPCREVELWISQDFVGGNSRMIHEPEWWGRNIEGKTGSGDFVDWLFGMEGRKIFPDRELSYRAWSVIESMRLRPSHLQIIKLYYLYGRKISECAVELGVSDQTAINRLEGARANVAKRLQDWKMWTVLNENLYLLDSVRARTVAMMKYGQLLSRTEIAIELGVSPTTISRDIRKIKKFYNGLT